MSQKVTLIVFCAVLSVSLLAADVTARVYFSRVQREIQNDDGKTRQCYRNAACGWEIYVPFSRKILDYMPNTCKCPAGTSCQRYDDDISVSAYVYRCLADSTTKAPFSTTAKLDSS